MEKQMYCISCPNGCLLTLELDDEGKLISVSGNTCPKGITYAQDEVTHPQRMLTSVVSVSGCEQPMLPVISDKPLPKKYLEEAIHSLRSVHVKGPVQAGDIVVKDILGTGVNILAAHSTNANPTDH